MAKPKSKNRILKFGVLIILIGILLLVVMHFKQNLFQSPPSNDWKTYTNTTYQYSLKYPNNLSVELFCEKNDEILISTSHIDCAPGSYGINTFRIVVYNKDILNSLLRPGIDEQGEIDPSTTFRDNNIKIEGINGKEVTWINKQGEIIYQQVILVTNGKTYRIENIPVSNFKNATQTFNQILSTFKFIN